MSDVSENILNNADTRNTFPVSKTEHCMDRLTEARLASRGRGDILPNCMRVVLVE